MKRTTTKALADLYSFIRCLNPFISQFDPKLHTFEYIQRKSSFLLTAILAASSKAFHPPLHAGLRAHAEKLLGTAFATGAKSVEVVQAIMVMTNWKEPDETRVWLLIGYAVRMCIELGWHSLERHPPPQGPDAELLIRERRNIERTWLIIFVYDRRYVAIY